MPRRGSVEESLSRLRAIRDPNSPKARQEISAALASGSGLLTERAATIIADAELGDSRREEAFAYLKSALEDAPEGESQAVLLAMAMLRTDEGLDFLFGLLNGRDIALAEQAYQALCVYEDDPDLKKRLEKEVKASKYRRLFEGPRRNWTE